MPRHPRRPGFALIAALGGLAAGLAALELGTRGLADPPRTHRTRPLELDPELGFRGVPQHRQTLRDALGPYELVLNGTGHRGPELPAAPPERGSIVLLGDSFFVAEALRFESGVTARLAARRRARGDTRPVYDLATVDYGTAQSLAALRRHAARARPVVIVLGLHPPNDVANDTLSLAGTTSVSAGDLVRPYWAADEAGRLRARPRWVSPWRAFGRRHSRAFAIVDLAALGWAEARGVEALGAFPPRPDREARLRAGRAPLAAWEVFRRHDDPGDPWEEGWRTTQAVVRALRDEAAGLGARLLVVVIPSEEQVRRTPRVLAEDLLVRRRTRRALASRLDWSGPERRLRAAFARDGIEAVWLLPWLRERARAGPVYTRDAHLGAAAHDELARRIDAWMEGRRPAPLELASEPAPIDPGVPGRRLDFRRDCALDAVGNGFLAWSAEAPAGWRLGRRGLLVIGAPEHPDPTFVVRGHWAAGGDGGLGLSIAWPDGRRSATRLQTPGSFEWRTAPPGPLPRADGRTVVVLERDRLSGSLTLESVGFGATVPEDPGRPAPCPDATRPP